MLTLIWINALQLADGVCALCAPVHMPGKNDSESFIPLRGLGPVNYDRLAKTYTVQFDVVRLHVDAITAMEFRAKHNASDIVNVGDFKAQWIDGGTTVTATIPGAAWDTVDPVIIGSISTRTRYLVTGGPMTVNRVDPAPDAVTTEQGIPIETESGNQVVTE